MISFTAAQWAEWMHTFLWPLARIMSCLWLLPLFNSRAIPQPAKISIGVLLTIIIAPTVSDTFPTVALGSTEAFFILAQQVLIGAAMGFSVRIVFSSIELAGDLIGLQMGLGFAVFYSPNSHANLPVVAQIFGMYALLILLAMNGHLMIIDVLARTFELLPVEDGMGQGINVAGLMAKAATIFSYGVLLALPLVVTLFIVNLALGILTRAAPQLNLFAIGFPLTLGLGILLLSVAMPSIGVLIQQILDSAFEAMAIAIR